MINCVCGSVAEAELAGGFQAAQTATHHRAILSDLGYPQPPTMLRMDNTVAIGIAAGQMNAKRPKSMDMRFYWLKDRVKRKQFNVMCCKGHRNISDHLTKDLPTQQLKTLRTYVIGNEERCRSVVELPILRANKTEVREASFEGSVDGTEQTEN